MPSMAIKERFKVALAGFRGFVVVIPEVPNKVAAALPEVPNWANVKSHHRAVKERWLKSGSRAAHALPGVIRGETLRHEASDRRTLGKLSLTTQDSTAVEKLRELCATSGTTQPDEFTAVRFCREHGFGAPAHKSYVQYLDWRRLENVDTLLTGGRQIPKVVEAAFVVRVLDGLDNEGEYGNGRLVVGHLTSCFSYKE